MFVACLPPLPRILRRTGAAAVATALSAMAAPAADEPCRTDAASDYCVRLLACIGDAGRWFDGRAHGRRAGPIDGLTNDGKACEGQWVARNAQGVGQADMRCDDGTTATVYFTYQHRGTGTAIGRGTASTGEAVHAWSGLHVLDFLRNRSGRPELPCGPRPIPIS